jgi:hypothetical protein
MTPAQKMRAAMLAKLGVTEEQLKAMSPEERKKIEDKLKDMIKQQVENDPKMKKGSCWTSRPKAPLDQPPSGELGSA